ncbi:MAG: hypothetical protein LIP01_05200 [Tannerellaceae bacterium]|nr:hypothetical protein [Tannerellaceae bacterium]
MSNGLYVHPAFIEEINLEEHFAPVAIGSVAGDNNLNTVHNGSINYTVTNPANQKTLKELIQTLHKITQEREVLIKTLGTVTAGNDMLKSEVEKLKKELENTKKILKTL